MRSAWIPSLLAVFIGLSFGCESERPPTLPGNGGGNGGTTTPPDAAPLADGVVANQVSGVLCVVSDIVFPLPCVPADLEGVTIRDRVTLQSTTASPGGDFSLSTQGGTEAVLEIGAGEADYRPTVLRVPLADGGATGLLIPLVPDDFFQDLLDRHAVILPDDTGTVVIFARSGGQPLTGAEVMPPLGLLNPPLFDTPGGPTVLAELTGTGPFGNIFLFGVPGGEQPTIEVYGPGGQPTVLLPQVPVGAAAITFELAQF